jgi:hypothetical protein
MAFHGGAKNHHSNNANATAMLDDDDCMVKICNFTFYREEELCEMGEDGDEDLDEEKDKKDSETLFSCSRCKQVFYKDRGCQKKHWPMHKQVCVKLHEDDPRIHKPFTTIAAALEVAHELLQDPMSRIRGRLFLHALKEFRRLLLETDEYEKRPAYVKQMVNAAIFQPLWRAVQTHGDAFLELIWAIPGFASHFLSQDILLSPAMKECKDKGQDPPPNEQYLAFGKIDPTTKHSDKIQLPNPYYTFVLKLFRLTASTENAETSYLKDTPLAMAGLRQIMHTWKCPYSRVSVPCWFSINPSDEWTSRSEYFFTFFILAFSQSAQGMTYNPILLHCNAITHHLRGKEWIPGMTMKSMIKVMMEDEALYYTLEGQSMRLLLTHVTDQSAPDEDEDEDLKKNKLDKRRWALSVEDRIELLSVASTVNPKLKEISTLPESSSASSSSKKSSKGGNQNFVSVYDALLDLVVGSLSVSTFFKMYYKTKQLESSSSTTPPHPNVIRFLRTQRAQLLASALPKAQLYATVIEQKYRQKYPSIDRDVNIPTELIELIAEFALPTKKAAPNWLFYSFLEGPAQNFMDANELSSVMEAMSSD